MLWRVTANDASTSASASASGEMRWGIIGAGSIARSFSRQLPSSATGRLVAVASRDLDRARAFADEFGAERAYGSYAELLDDPEVDAVYIATIHPEHARWAIAAARAGKHILCEKPMTTSPAATMAVIEAARTHDVALLEAFMVRFHPQWVAVAELLRSGGLGDVQHIAAEFSFATSATSGRLVEPELGGGAIFDVGGYPIQAALLVARAAGETRLLPERLEASGTVDAHGVDEWATTSLAFAGGLTAHLAAGVRLNGENRVRIFGSRGVLAIETPWVPEPDAVPRVTLTLVGEQPRDLPVPAAAQYALEADALAAAAASPDRRSPGLSPEESQAIAAIMGRWRDAIGARYASESPTADLPPVSGIPPRPAVGAPMRFGRVAGLDKDISRLVMGCDNQQTLSHASVMFDDFFERGGNAFDTAYHYGGGNPERLLGQWLVNRGLRDEVVIIAKGAHTPNCTPQAIDSQLAESLERMQLDAADLYFMHRDNPEVPVGEFVDVLDAHVRAGRIAAFGGSNWTTARIDEANAYAAANGRHGFTLLSNHFGLAECYDARWAGCEHATDAASKAWLERTQTPIFPWSSQSAGFFARADPDDRSDADLVRCYYSAENFERLRRTRELAARLGVEPTAVALAYVLHQPFPTFPLIGPRTLAETRTSMAALSIDLTPEQVRWLDLRD
jgi:aryl-alcohol dehydrogenase-like predicted oxidoreductase/predicted dehydrogenase